MTNPGPVSEFLRQVDNILVIGQQRASTRHIWGIAWLILVAYALQLCDLAGDSLRGSEILSAAQLPLPDR